MRAAPPTSLPHRESRILMGFAALNPSYDYSPFRTAEAFWIEEIIDPRDTRRLAVEFAGLAEKLREPGRSCLLHAAVIR